MLSTERDCGHVTVYQIEPWPDSSTLKATDLLFRAVSAWRHDGVLSVPPIFPLAWTSHLRRRPDFSNIVVNLRRVLPQYNKRTSRQLALKPERSSRGNDCCHTPARLGSPDLLLLRCPWQQLVGSLFSAYALSHRPGFTPVLAITSIAATRRCAPLTNAREYQRLSHFRAGSGNRLASGMPNPSAAASALQLTSSSTTGPSSYFHGTFPLVDVRLDVPGSEFTRQYVAMLSDVYFFGCENGGSGKEIQASTKRTGPSDDVPGAAARLSPRVSLPEFVGAERLDLPRLEDGATSADVDARVAAYPGEGDRAIRIVGVIPDWLTRHEHEAAFIVRVGSVQERDEWLSLLRLRVSPLSLLNAEFVAALDTAAGHATFWCGDEAWRALTSTRSSGATSGGAIIASGVSLEPEEPQRASDLVAYLAEGGAWAATVSQAIANLARGRNVVLHEARGLGSVALVGPVLQVLTLSLRCAALVGKEMDSQSRVPLLRARLLHAGRGLMDMILRVKEVGLSQEYRTYFAERLFSAVSEGWSVLLGAEQLMLSRTMTQPWQADEVDRFEDIVKRVEVRLDVGRLLQIGALGDFKIVLVAGKLIKVDAKVTSLDMKDIDIVLGSYGDAMSDKVDNFIPGAFAVPPMPHTISPNAVPQLEGIVEAVLSSRSTLATPGKGGLAVAGMGGIGKTSALILVAHDERVRKRFKDGVVLWMALGPGATDTDLARELMVIVRGSGGRATAEEMENVWDRWQQSPSSRLNEVIRLGHSWLHDKLAVVFSDNNWPRRHAESDSDRREYPELVSHLLGKNGSVLVYTTRMPNLALLAEKRFDFVQLDMGRESDQAAAVEVFELHAGIGDGEGQRNESGNLEYLAAREEILILCDGWHLAIGICGELLAVEMWNWSGVVSRLRKHIQRGGPGIGNGIKAVMETSLGFLDGLDAEDPLLDEVDVIKLREWLGTAAFKDLFALLAVFAEVRFVPVHALGPLFRVGAVEGKAIAGLFVSVGLAVLSYTPGVDGAAAEQVFSLHVLQQEYPELLCDTAGLSVARQHELLLDGYARRLGANGLQPNLDWSDFCVEGRLGDAGRDEYLCMHLARHMALAVGGAGRGSARDKYGVGVGKSLLKKCYLGLLCDYSWIRARGRVYGRRSVDVDMTTMISGINAAAAAGRNPDDRSTADADSGSCFSDGELRGALAIADVLRLISPHRFAPRAPCRQHGDRGLGLAGELDGRLALRLFAGLDESERPAALGVVSLLRQSIRERELGPWLSSRFDCYKSVERTDERCVMASNLGEGQKNGLAHMPNCGRMVVSACPDHIVRLQDLDDGGCEVERWVGHSHVVADVAVARGSGECDSGSVVVASCSWDGTVRLWTARARDGGGWTGDHACDQVLRCSNGDWLMKVAITPDARRVVAAGFGDSSDFVSLDGHSIDGDRDSVGDADDDPNAVHVWTRRGEGIVGGLGTTSYATIALAGHERWAEAVCISRDGTCVMSGGNNGKILVWHVPMTAASAADVEPPRVFECREEVNDGVYSLALASDASTLFAGTVRGAVQIWDVESGRLVASLRTARAPDSVQCLSLVEACGVSEGSGALFAGHENGVISEWSLSTRECAAVYGDPRSWAGADSPAARIASITARLVAEDSEAGSRTSAGDGSSGGGGGIIRCEFVTGHCDGTVCVWRTGGCNSGSSADDVATDEPETGQGGAAPEDGRPLRHVDVARDFVMCMTASADGMRLVSGSSAGLVCVWDVASGTCVASLRHEESVHCVDVSCDGRVVASCSGTTSRLWKQAGGGWEETVLRGHEGDVHCVSLFADLRRAVTGDAKGVLRVWDASSGKLLQCLPQKHSGPIAALAMLMTRRVGNASSESILWITPQSDSVVIAALAAIVRGSSVSGNDAPRDGGEDEPLISQLFSSRDSTGQCCLWAMDGERVVLDATTDVLPDRPLAEVFVERVEGSGAGSWHETRFWWIHRPNEFRLNASSGSGSTGCVLGRNRSDARCLLVTSRSAMLDPMCTCVAILNLESDIVDSSLFAFERNCGGNGEGELVVCCGLADGTVAVFDFLC
jgi:WD40 repeat protein